MPEWLKEWWPAIALVVMVAAPLVVAAVRWVFRKGLVSQDNLAETVAVLKEGQAAEVKLLNQRLDDLGRRIDKVERFMDHLATKDDISEVLLKLSAQDGERRTLAAKIDGLGQVMERIMVPLDMLTQQRITDGG